MKSTESRSRKVRSRLLMHLIKKKSTNQWRRSLSSNHTYFVIDVCDVHAVQDVILEVVPQYPSQNIKRYVGPVQRHRLHKQIQEKPEKTLTGRVTVHSEYCSLWSVHLAWPMCEASYTVGPQQYHVTLFPSWGTNSSWNINELIRESIERQETFIICVLLQAWRCTGAEFPAAAGNLTATLQGIWSLTGGWTEW